MATSPSGIGPGVLPYQEIIRLCGLQGSNLDESQGTGPIQPCRRDNVRSASYDLRLGSDYHFSGVPETPAGVGSMQVASLTPGSDEHIVIPPNQVVVVSSLEKVCLPEDMIGHLTLKQDILLQGLIMGSQSQVDAGYSGWIYPLLYNLTNSPVTLQLKQSIIRLELVRLPERTNEAYKGDYQGKRLSETLKSPIGSSLAALRKEMDERGRQLRNTRIGATIAAIALPILLAYVTGFVGDVRDARDSVARLEGEVGSVKIDRQVDRLERRVAELQCEMRNQGDPAARRRC